MSTIARPAGVVAWSCQSGARPGGARALLSRLAPGAGMRGTSGTRVEGEGQGDTAMSTEPGVRCRDGGCEDALSV